MVRTWMREVYAPWLTVFVPLCLVAALILPPQWAVVLVWWLKPALDRVVLHVLANGVFGDLPRLRETLKALPHALTPGLLTSLTLFRFFLARSFNLPVWQLERQRGQAARQRRQQLQRRTGSYAVWLTVACLQFELALALSVDRYLRSAGARLQRDGLRLLQADARARRAHPAVDLRGDLLHCDHHRRALLCGGGIRPLPQSAHRTGGLGPRGRPAPHRRAYADQRRAPPDCCRPRPPLSH